MKLDPHLRGQLVRTFKEHAYPPKSTAIYIGENVRYNRQRTGSGLKLQAGQEVEIGKPSKQDGYINVFANNGQPLEIEKANLIPLNYTEHGFAPINFAPEDKTLSTQDIAPPPHRDVWRRSPI